jgi:SAM-dependent methyltransferase
MIANTSQAEAWNGWEGDHWAQHPERYNGMVEAFNDALLAAAGIEQHDQVLDVGCGTGRITLLAARLAARGHVTGVDLSAAMLRRATKDAAAQGITNVTFEQGDAQVHPFSGFDVAISRGGVMFFADPVAAFANIARGLRTGGRLAFITPGAPNPDGPYSRATAALGPLMRGPSPAQRGMGSLSDPDRIREVLAAAGCEDVTITPVEASMNLGRDATDATDFILATGPVRVNLEKVDPATVEKVREEVRAGFAPHETPDGVCLPGAVWVTAAHC